MDDESHTAAQQHEHAEADVSADQVVVTPAQEDGGTEPDGAECGMSDAPVVEDIPLDEGQAASSQELTDQHATEELMQEAVTTEAAEPEQLFQYLSCSFPQSPELVYESRQEYTERATRHCPNSNFLKGVKWSPDGACLLTASDDNGLRIFDLPSDASTAAPVVPSSASGDSIGVGLCATEGETIYDYAWYSRMTTSDAVSCCFASTTRGNPIHLWDACSGEMRCTYRAYDDADEITPAYSLAFSPDGTKLFGGYKKSLRVFDISRPGRDSYRVNTYIKREASLAGIISCIACCEPHHQFACGSYVGTVAVFDFQAYRMQLLLQGHQGGVTHALFSQDGNFLFTGARQDPNIICWDVRYARDAVYRLNRSTASTNQRVYFDIEPGGRFLSTGGTDGGVKVFDLQSGEEVQHLQVSNSTVNGCGFHPHLPFLAVATGHRHYPLQLRDVDSSDSEVEGVARASSDKPAVIGPDNALQVWRLQHSWLTWAPHTTEEVIATEDECDGAASMDTDNIVG